MNGFSSNCKYILPRTSRGSEPHARIRAMRSLQEVCIGTAPRIEGLGRGHGGVSNIEVEVEVLLEMGAMCARPTSC